MNQLKYMEKMEKILRYILERLGRKDSLEDTARALHYHPAYFSRICSEYFGFPYNKFVGKLRMRQAAADLKKGLFIKSICQKYGYASAESFSKAFHKEFGVSPRQFKKSFCAIPDMPLPERINGKKFTMEYRTASSMTYAGWGIPYEGQEKLDIFKQIAYGYAHPEKYAAFQTHTEKYASPKWCGVWRSAPDLKLQYYMGQFVSTRPPGLQKDEAMPGADIFQIPGADYAVFTFETGENRADTCITSQMAAQYIKHEWAVMNHKFMDYMSYIYEEFSDATCSIYIPLLGGMGGVSLEEDTKNGVDDWVRYVDEHIFENLTVSKIAEYFYYSPGHFCDVFRMYYDMNLTDYIRRRKLYHIAKAIKEDAIDVTAIQSVYHVKSWEAFRLEFWNEFHMQPEEYPRIGNDAINLPAYYTQNKKRIKIASQHIDDLYMIGLPLKKAAHAKENALDIPGLCQQFYRHDPPCLFGTKYACPKEGQEDKAALWIEDKSNPKSAYAYILGPLTDSFDNVPKEMEKAVIKGGPYAIFTTENEKDSAALKDAYRMLTICVFYGWVKENRYRVDFERITFSRYKNEKLYFYVPIYV